MTTVTIPKELARRGDLVVIPRKEYERLLRVVKPKKKTALDRALDEAIAEVERGKTLGPFSSVREFKRAMEK